MNSQKLAIFGGSPTIQRSFTPYKTIGKEEIRAVNEVLEKGELSRFLGAWHPDFYGGEKNKELEKNWEKYFNVNYAVTVNSNTSGLIAAIGAIDIQPGDEVIVSPWTMCASATCVLAWNAIPIFADIDPKTFNLSPESIEKNITPLTKAIVVSDIFGQAADLYSILDIAKKYNLKVIEDAAQAPGAQYNNQYVGTIADIGVYSLNYHKHIHTGEGGVCVTNDPILAERLQLIRNHAEAVVEKKGVSYLSNMIGFNFRMTEIEAAIGIEQLKKLPEFIKKRKSVAQQLNSGLNQLKGLELPYIAPNRDHVYYVYGLKIDKEQLTINRDTLIKALQAEGVPALAQGYTQIHLLPMYQNKIAYGNSGFPWKNSSYRGHVSYKKGICPVAEMLHDELFFSLGVCVYEFTPEETELVVTAFQKVWSQIDTLKSLEENK